MCVCVCVLMLSKHTHTAYCISNPRYLSTTSLLRIDKKHLQLHLINTRNLKQRGTDRIADAIPDNSTKWGDEIEFICLFFYSDCLLWNTWNLCRWYNSSDAKDDHFSFVCKNGQKKPDNEIAPPAELLFERFFKKLPSEESETYSLKHTVCHTHSKKRDYNRNAIKRRCWLKK